MKTLNNGWIKIESEDDLPKKEIYVFLIDKKKGFDKKPYQFNPEINACIKYLLKYSTHYNPIIVPNLP